MKVEKRDSSRERDILTAMIVSDQVLADIAPKWDKEGLFRSPWSNLVGGWCVTFNNKYGKAPNKNIEGLFRSWADGAQDKDLVRAIEKFLGQLSGSYTRRKRDINVPYLLDRAGLHFNEVRIKRLADAINGDVDSNKLDQAIKRLGKWDQVNVGQGKIIDVFQDKEAWKRTFDSSNREPIVTLPGAIGQLIGRRFERDGFVAIMGQEKIGKCVAESAEVLLADGSVRTIREIVENRIDTPVLSYNEETGKFVQTKIKEYWCNGEKEVWEVKTRTGRKIKTTLNHQYLTQDGWKYLEQISPGDYIAVPKRIEVFGNKIIPESEVKFLAYMLAEGCSRSTTPTWTNNDPFLVSDFDSCCKDLGFTTRRKGITTHVGWDSNRPNTLLKKHGMKGILSKCRVLPQVILTCPKEQVALFLRVFFTCDGCIVKRRKIELTLASRVLVKQIAHLLSRFGIVCKVTNGRSKYKGRKFRSARLSILDAENVNRFLTEINFLSVKDTSVFDPGPSKSFLDKLPWQIAEQCCDELKAEYGRKKPSLAGVGNYLRPNHNFRQAIGRNKWSAIRQQIRKQCPIMRQSFSQLPKKGPTYEKYLNSDVLWDEVVSIKKVGVERTYDIAIPEHHNFVANNIIVHNSYWMQWLAYRAMLQRRKVFYLQIGDLSESQQMMRFGVLASGKPMEAQTVVIPKEITKLERGYDVKLIKRKFKHDLTFKEAMIANERVMKQGVKSKESYLKLQVEPMNSVAVADIKTSINSLARKGWVPDLVVIDYADLLAPPPGYTESRDQTNHNWKEMRRISQEFHCLVLTGTQIKADGYKAESLDMTHFSEDKRKFAHVTGMLGLNQKEEEKEQGITRIGWVVLREAGFSIRRHVRAAGSLALANPCMRSSW